MINPARARTDAWSDRQRAQMCAQSGMREADTPYGARERVSSAAVRANIPLGTLAGAGRQDYYIFPEAAVGDFVEEREWI